MAFLANNSQANPLNSFYAIAGQGADNSLQSPATVTPDVALGDSILTLPAAGTGVSQLILTSPVESSVTLTGGDAFIALNGTDSVHVNLGDPNAQGVELLVDYTTSPSLLQVLDSTNTVATFNTAANSVNLLNPLAVGGGSNTVFINGEAIVTSSGTRPVPSGITLTPASPTQSTISQAVAQAGELSIGSSVAAPNTIQLSDAGASTAQCVIGGNGGTNVSINGGTVANPGLVGANIRTDAASSGVLTIGSSTSNPTTMFVKDTGAAGTGFVDVAGGVFNSIALRLQGANAQVGSNAAQVSTNNAAAQNPTLNISNSVDGTPAIVITTATVQINKLITGYLNGTTAAQAALLDNNSVPIPGSDYGSLGAGLFCILAKTTNQTSPSGQVGTQVSSMGYMSSVTQKWIGGNGFGQALINPTRNFFIQVSADFTGLVFGNTSGFDMNATWTVTFIRLSGDLGI
jgi:hypothetical protein